MATAWEKLDFNVRHLVGKIIFAPDDAGIFDSCDFPQQSEDILIITSADLKKNSVEIGKTSFPVFAEPGKPASGIPVAAVFGTDMESVSEYMGKIQIHSHQPEPQESDTEDLHPFVWNYGKCGTFFDNPETTSITSDFTVKRHCMALKEEQKIIANAENDRIYLRLTTQWPSNVKQSVASALGTETGNITLLTEDRHAPYDQLVYLPSVYGIIAAAAASLRQCQIFLSVPSISWQGDMVFRFRFAFDAKFHPLAQDVRVDIERGPSPVFSDEFCYNILTGLIPNYGLKAAHVEISTSVSCKPAALFFSDSGYAMSLAAREHCYNEAIRNFGILPSEWRKQNIHEKDALCFAIKSVADTAALSQTVSDCCRYSEFDRNYSVNCQPKLRKRDVNPFMNYSRGTGLASGHGISGFSNECPYTDATRLSVVMTDAKHMEINVPVNINRPEIDFWKGMSANIMGIPGENIIFNIGSGSQEDNGPYIHSAGYNFIGDMIKKACVRIVASREASVPYPIKEMVGIKSENKHVLFNCTCAGSAAVDLHIDPVLLCPVIDHVTVRVHHGREYRNSVMKSILKRTAETAIKEVCPFTCDKIDVNLDTYTDNAIPSGFAAPLVRGLVVAAFTDALSQALDFHINSLPLTQQDILDTVNTNRSIE